VWDEKPLTTALIVMVDLFNAKGELPRNLDEVGERQKDVQYATKQRFTNERAKELGELRQALKTLLTKLPANLKDGPEARKLASSIRVGKRPRGIGFTPDGSRAYVACEIANTVIAIDVASRKVLATIPAGGRSNGIKVHPTGREVYVSNGADGTVMVIDTTTNAVTHTIKVGNRPWNMALTADGGKLYVANGRSNSVSVIDTVTKKELKQIKVGEQPWGVLIPGGH
jgi:YVTN family beta-propeller protein